MKFIIYYFGNEIRVVLFSNKISHNSFWNNYSLDPRLMFLVSAGVVIRSESGDMVVVHGSQTLDIEQDEERGKIDLEIIKKELTGMN